MIDQPAATRAFRFEYDPPIIRFGAGRVDSLASDLESLGCESAIVVTGQTVGETPAVMDPVRAGLGDRLAEVFAETTPAKRLRTALAARDRYEACGADAFVAVGGGSSLDVATIASLLVAIDDPPAAILTEFAESGSLTVPDRSLPPVVTIPTTLAGADLSNAAGITIGADDPVARGEPIGGGLAHPRLLPALVVADPELVATTPRSILAPSVMNGFDKGLETIYARTATPITDATASRGLGRMADGVRALGGGDWDGETVGRLLEGSLLVQYGISRPNATTLSIVHAFGHALSRTTPLQQGVAHAIVVPHVLAHLFEAPGVDARPDILAAALGCADGPDPAASVLETVTDIRDRLGLPGRLRDVDGPDRPAFDALAEHVLENRLLANAPPGFDPTHGDLVGILEAAW